jgi:hypothetical protein
MRTLPLSWRKTLLVGAVMVATLAAFSTWYKIHYSMDVARSFEVNDPHSTKPRVLVATQGSEFKDAVVSGVVDHLETRPAYVKVIDVSALPGVNEDEWDAIVIVHTWEMRKPQADAQAFKERARNARKLVVLSTSGAGDFKMEGVDLISSASILADVPARVEAITVKVDAILDASHHSTTE